MNAEELIRAAFEHQASRAPNADRVLAGFRPSRRRARVWRRTGLTLTAIATAAAIGVPVVALRTGGQETPLVPLPSVPAQPLLFAPTWIPSGLTTQTMVAAVPPLDRPGISAGFLTIRTWAPRSGHFLNDPPGTVTLTVRGRGMAGYGKGSGTGDIRVRGHRAYRFDGIHGGGACAISWQES
ncbi:MAG TPA: hypothetical protein VNW94_10300, partial [Streptosporangiaceae bacterium]|nr:hypothetical protein [Streptosporangiaceae bacterium]